MDCYQNHRPRPPKRPYLRHSICVQVSSSNTHLRRNAQSLIVWGGWRRLYLPNRFAWNAGIVIKDWAASEVTSPIHILMGSFNFEVSSSSFTPFPSFSISPFEISCIRIKSPSSVGNETRELCRGDGRKGRVSLQTSWISELRICGAIESTHLSCKISNLPSLTSWYHPPHVGDIASCVHFPFDQPISCILFLLGPRG